MFPQLGFRIIKQLFNGVDPRGILGIEDDGCVHLFCSFLNHGVLVNRSIIHQYNDVLVFDIGSLTQAVQCPVQEVLEYYRISPTLSDLHGDHSI